MKNVQVSALSDEELKDIVDVLMNKNRHWFKGSK